MKKYLSIICVVAICFMAFSGAFYAETVETEVWRVSGESLENLAREGVSVYSDNQLCTVSDSEVSHKENAVGFSSRMFGNVYSMWGFCTPLELPVIDITVRLVCSIHAFDEMAWEVYPDGFLDEVSTIYEEQNILGYSIGENRQWITGREYNAAPVFYNSERGYYYKVFEFNFTDVGPYSEGKVYHEWDGDQIYMSLVTHSVTYFTTADGKEIRNVDEDDVTYGSLENLTGIVAAYHTYTDLSCGEQLLNDTYPAFMIAENIRLEEGEHKLKIEGEFENADVIVFSSDDVVIAHDRLTSAADNSAEMSFNMKSDDTVKIMIVQTPGQIKVTSVSILKHESKPEPKVLYGDLNGDEEINATDALICLQCAVGKFEADEDTLKVGNVDGKDDITATDALLILQYSVGKITLFPIEE